MLSYPKSFKHLYDLLFAPVVAFRELENENIQLPAAGKDFLNMLSVLQCIALAQELQVLDLREVKLVLIVGIVIHSGAFWQLNFC